MAPSPAKIEVAGDGGRRRTVADGGGTVVDSDGFVHSDGFVNSDSR